MEHIVLESDSPVISFEQDKVHINGQLLQKISYRNKVLFFTLFNDRYLRYRQLKPKKQQKAFCIDLTFIDPIPKKISHFSWFWLSCFLGLIGVGAVLYLLNQPLAYFAALLCAIAVSILATIHCSYSSYQFYSLHGQTMIFELMPNNPNKKLFQVFMRLMTQKISSANNSQQTTKKRRLKLELQVHRNLYHKGILSNEQYEQAKKRILAQYD